MDIKNVLKKHGYTIQAAADKMNIERVTLSRNISKNPTIGTLRRLAEATDIPFWEFFADELPSGNDDSSFVCPTCGTKLKITKVEDDADD